MSLPIYELRINPEATDETEVNYVALVDVPAIQRDFVAFNEHQQIKFKIENEEKRIVSGPAMIPDMLIYRKSDKFGEHYVKFPAEEIKNAAIKFFKKRYTTNVNQMHSDKLRMDDVVIFESFISDPERGIAPIKGFEDLPTGTWFMSMYVQNDEAWERVKSGDFRGFSIEGSFGYSIPQQTPEQMIEAIARMLNVPINH